MSPEAWLYHYTDARSLVKLLESMVIEAYDPLGDSEVATSVYLTEVTPDHSDSELVWFYSRYGYKVSSGGKIDDGLYYLKLPLTGIGSLENLVPKIYTTRKACIDLNGLKFKVGKTHDGKRLWELDAGTCWITDTAKSKSWKQYEERQPQSTDQAKPRVPTEEDLQSSQLYARQGTKQCGAPASQLEDSLQTLSEQTRRRITTIVSLAVADHGRQGLETISKILGYNDLLNKGKRSKDAVRDMIEWAATGGQQIEILHRIFNAFGIEPGICSFLEHISTADAVAATKRTSLPDRAEVSGACPAGLRDHPTMPPPTQERLIIADSASLSKIVKTIATEAAKIPGLRLSRFHCFEDMMKIYVDLDGDNLHEVESRLKQLAKNQGYLHGVHIHDEKPPGVSPCCGPNVCLGGKVLVSGETEVVARVSGYLTDHDGACKYATTVGHVFDQSADDDCLLSEFVNPTQRCIGECVAKINNVSPVDLLGIGDERPNVGFYDISFVKLLRPESARISNRFCGIRVNGINPRLQPFLDKSITFFHNYLLTDVYVVNTAREAPASVGRVTDVAYTGLGDPNFISVRLERGAQFQPGDSGSLVTGFSPMTDDLQVPAYGLVAGVLDTPPAAPAAAPQVQANNESPVICVLPFWPQVDQLCLEHTRLLWAQRDQLKFHPS